MRPYLKEIPRAEILFPLEPEFGRGERKAGAGTIAVLPKEIPFMITLSDSAKKELDACFKDTAPGTIRIFLASGG